MSTLIPLRCRFGLHDWRGVGLMNIWYQYTRRCARCGLTVVRQG